MPDIPKVYSPDRVEKAQYRRWLKGEYFTASLKASIPAYAIVIPPPNITGSLHLGHALNCTLQDILVRWKRMQGCNVLWMPGTDHAGIATQNVVERQLMAEGKDRESLGREEFIRRVWRWREQSGRTIIQQLKHLGASCDWSRERFTMDEGLSAAVREVFVKLYEEELIYRGERLINWCPRCQTALSDIEVEHEEGQGRMFYIRYPLADDPKQSLTVATTRPETMLGDTAVAVHPEDSRYNRFIGKRVSLPLTHRKIPVVGDPILVDREFGTGAVKITPAHDFNDFEAGLRHDLPRISIFDEKARMRHDLEREGTDPAIAAEIADLEVPKARAKIQARLEEGGHLLKIEDHRLALGRCYRCKTVVEPYLSSQWFVNIGPLARPAVEAVRSGRIRFIPAGWQNSYFSWMENIKDWCISRQIWWGHRIPAWYCRACHPALHARPDGTPVIPRDAKPFVAKEPPKACPACGAADLIQDPDVLDTWFSSALWPFSTLGWPERTPELERFYPTSVLVTSFDIIFFWVSRMIMMGLKFMGEIPFREVYIHALVRDAYGQKMSKSKGNVIDPLGVMEKFGTDALRFTLSSMASPGRDVKLSEQRIEGYRNFANKLWNAARYLFLKLEDLKLSDLKEGERTAETDSPADRWIRSRTQKIIGDVNEALEQYRFDEASHRLYHFIWHEFCDWYVEFSKFHLSGPDPRQRAATGRTLVRTFDVLLRLLHPFMPFITEELWQQLPAPLRETPKGPQTIMLADYPRPDPRLVDEALEEEMNQVMGIVTQIRSFCREMKISPAHRIPAVLSLKDASRKDAYRSCAPYIENLARLSSLKIGAELDRPENAIALPLPWGEVYLALKGILDFEKAREWIQGEIRKIGTEKERVARRLGDASYREKAPEDVVAKDEGRREELENRLSVLEQYRRQLEASP